MRKNNISLALCIFCIFSICSCEDKNGYIPKEDLEILKKSQPEFDLNRQVIYYKEEMKNDIKCDIDFLLDTNNPQNFGLGCRLSFFNYGDDICLCKGYDSDFFVTGIGTIKYAHVIETGEDILVNAKGNSKNYGEWALASISIGKGSLNNIFVTPLALKAHKAAERDNLILIQFANGNKYLNVLFCGSSKEVYIVKYYPQLIIPGHAIWDSGAFDSNEGPGTFWHQIN